MRKYPDCFTADIAQTMVHARFRGRVIPARSLASSVFPRRGRGTGWSAIRIPAPKRTIGCSGKSPPSSREAWCHFSCETSRPALRMIITGVGLHLAHAHAARLQANMQNVCAMFPPHRRMPAGFLSSTPMRLMDKGTRFLYNCQSVSASFDVNFIFFTLFYFFNTCSDKRLPT